MLTQHRMVVAESFIREDAATEDRNYYAVAGAVTHF
jgi:hypothetical protein